MESFKSEPQFSPFSPRKPSLFLFFVRSCSITLDRTQPIKIELLSYYLTIMVRYRNLVRQIGPSESTVQGTFFSRISCLSILNYSEIIFQNHFNVSFKVKLDACLVTVSHLPSLLVDLHMELCMEFPPRSQGLLEYQGRQMKDP